MNIHYWAVGTDRIWYCVLAHGQADNCAWRSERGQIHFVFLKILPDSWLTEIAGKHPD